MKASGALQHVAHWYPSDEPDLRMPAASLNTILAAIKAQSPAVPILLTLSNLAMNQTTGRLNYALDTAPLKPTDVLTFDIYSGGSVPWGAMEAKLDVLSAFVSAHGLSMAVIPDATAGTFAALGAAGNNVLNDQFYRCAPSQRQWRRWRTCRAARARACVCVCVYARVCDRSPCCAPLSP